MATNTLSATAQNIIVNNLKINNALTASNTTIRGSLSANTVQSADIICQNLYAMNGYTGRIVYHIYIDPTNHEFDIFYYIDVVKGVVTNYDFYYRG